MSLPRLSVAMSVYNNAPYLALAIESILAQTFGDFEFLIVNDGSSDGSREIIDHYAAADARVRPIHQENRGLVASLNRLIAESRAPLIARMDGDDIALPERFERQLAFLDAHPDYGVLGTFARCIDEQGRPRGPCGEKPERYEDLLAKLETGPLLCHPSVIMRREVVQGVGGYHPAFRHCEDYDLWLRLANVTRMCNLPDRLILYRHSESQVSTKHIVEQHLNAAIAYLAYLERAAGRPDPTQGLRELPGIEGLDGLFGKPGLGREVRAKIAPNLLYSPVALRGEGYDLILAHVGDGGTRDGMWRAAARLVALGETKRAFRLATALAAA